jgi:CspA family cold shock protein
MELFGMPQCTGRLKFWSTRGYGFLVRNDGSGEDYLHITAVEASGVNPDNLKPGTRLAYDLEQDVKRNNMMKATNVQLLD